MASKVRFTDGTTTVTFDGTTDGKIVSYDIRAPELRRLSVSRITKDGEEMIAQAYQDVTEDLTLYVSGTTSAIKATIQKLNMLWERVRRYQDAPIESKVYIQVWPEGDSEYWQCELKSVESDLEPRALDLYLAQGKLIFNVTVVRAYFWEKTADVELSLYNPGQSKGTGGKSISNAYDSNGAGADRYNFLDIDNADLVGDLPARLKVKMTNTYASTDRDANVFVGLSHKTDVANFDHVIEGEDTTYGTQQPGSPDYTLYSEGYYRHLSWTGTAETIVGRWDLPTTLLNAAKSNYYMVYAKMNTGADVYVRMKINADGGLATLWTGPQVLLAKSTNNPQCLGAVQLPPIRQIGGSPYPEELTLTAQAPSGGTTTLDVDYFLLSPMDRWRQYYTNGSYLAQNAYLMDDGINERVYTNGWATAGDYYNYAAYGPWLEVVPVPEGTGKHRLIFCWSTLGNVIPRTMSVQIWYRPRRKQI